MAVRLQQNLQELKEIFDSNPLSKGKLFSKNDFKQSADCFCGWSISLQSSKKPSRILKDIKSHYAKKVEETDARKSQSMCNKHKLFGFFLESDQIVRERPNAVCSWLKPDVPSPKEDSQSVPHKRKLTDNDVVHVINEFEQEVKQQDEKRIRLFDEATETDVNQYRNSVNVMTAEFPDEEIKPRWLTNLEWAHRNKSLDEVQVAILGSFANSLVTTVLRTKYSDLQKYFWKLVELSCSESDYELIRRLQGGPTSRTLRDFQCSILADTGVTIRNMKLAQSYFEEVRCEDRYVLA